MQPFIYQLLYLVFSILGNYNYFFFAAHLLDVAVGVAALRIILEAITHNGKQLVFMGMAVVVIAVAIFLMGVQVGRGVRGERGLSDGADVVAATTTETEPPLPPPSVNHGSTTAPVTAGEKLSYAERLTGNIDGDTINSSFSRSAALNAGEIQGGQIVISNELE